MINKDTYISIIFAIIIAAFYGAGVTISTQNRQFNKRKAITIVTVTTILLIVILTIVYGYGKFEFSKLLPFGKQQYADDLFEQKYLKYLFYFSCFDYANYIHIFIRCGNDIGWAADHSVILDKRYVIITILFHFPISIYAHTWYIYMLCYYSFSLIICLLISIVLIIIEFCVLYFINKHLTFRKASKIRFSPSKSSIK